MEGDDTDINYTPYLRKLITDNLNRNKLVAMLGCMKDYDPISGAVKNNTVNIEKYYNQEFHLDKNLLNF